MSGCGQRVDPDIDVTLYQHEFKIIPNVPRTVSAVPLDAFQ